MVSPPETVVSPPGVWVGVGSASSLLPHEPGPHPGGPPAPPALEAPLLSGAGDTIVVLMSASC